MRSKTYWENRAESRVHESQKNADQTIFQIAAAYDQAVQNLNADIENIFANLQLKNGLDAAEAKRILNQKIPNFVYKAMLKLLPKVQSKKVQNWLKARINAQAYKARITRAEALKESIYMQLKMLADVELTKSEALYLDTIEESYYKTAFDFQKGIGYGIHMAALSEHTMKSILNYPWSGEHYSNRVWNNTDYLAKQLNRIVTSVLLSGKDWRKMSKEIQRQMDVGKFAANRLIRTEVAYMNEQSSIASMQDNGTEAVEILATLDKRTSQICQKKDGDIVPIDEIKIGVNHPPFHPHCRSTSVPVVDMAGMGTRIARDPDTGENYKVPATMKYEDWKKTFVKTDISEKGSYSHGIERIGNNTVDLGYINSAEFRKKFNRVTGNSKINDLLRRYAIAMLTHRNRTDGEDLYIINASTGDLLIRKNSGKNDLGVELTVDEFMPFMEKYKNNMIGMHNHPTNIYPTGSDFAVSGYRGYKFGIIVTHDGRVFKYRHGDKPFLPSIFDKRVDKYLTEPYNLGIEKAHLRVIEEFKKEYGILWEEIKS